MSETKYAVSIEDSQERGIVFARGSLNLVAAAVKEGLAEIAGKEGDFTARFVEVAAVDGMERRQILSLTAEEDIVATTLRKRLANEKKADTPAERGSAPVTAEEARDADLA